METEDISPRFVDLDGWPTLDAVEAMYEGQLVAIAAVRPALRAIARAAEDGAQALQRSGRLVYVGAGTSGRVGVQDGVELPPTFAWPRERLVFVMAGGPGALTSSVEGAEDDSQDAVRQIDAAGIGGNDVVVGIAASGTTPFTVAALGRATERGAVTIGIASNASAPLLGAAKHAILVETGVEVIAGSTRMKAGTAHKAVLNLLSSAMMIRLGRVYLGMMVHMRPSNAKLRRRAQSMVATVTGRDAASVSRALEGAGWDVKLASVMAFGLARDAAAALLDRHGGNLRAALAEIPGATPPARTPR